MGCISSKAINRSMSIREELNNRFQSKSAAWEELLTSHGGGNDQLFALVCSANSTTKLRSSSFTLPSADPQTPPQTRHLANAWDLIQDMKEKTELGSAPDSAGEPNFVRFTRSKSCQTIREKAMLGLDPETDGLKENKLDWKDKNLIGSRSFHTVEEYDALLERIHKVSTRNVQPLEDYYSWEDVKLQQQQSHSLDENQNDRRIQRITEDGCSSMRNSNNFDNVVQEDGTRETGWKRKAAAKGLRSLDVPPIEFPAIARLRHPIHAEGQVYSPGTYITPKFGSYNAKMAPIVKEKGGGESEIFSPDLLAAFEDCMQQLQQQEDSILSHLDEYLPINDESENQVEQAPSNLEIGIMTN